MKKIYIKPAVEFEAIDDNLMEDMTSPYKPKPETTGEGYTNEGSEYGGETTDPGLFD